MRSASPKAAAPEMDEKALAEELERIEAATQVNRPTYTGRAVDLHSFYADPDPAVFMNADPDPAVFIFMNADPDPGPGTA